jgi:hypothetical protein
MLEAPSQSAIFGQVHLGSEIPRFYLLRKVQVGLWQAWAPLMQTQIMWILTKNRVWIADQLRKGGWPNCRLCPFRKEATESACHLLVNCRFTKRIWQGIKSWIGITISILTNGRVSQSSDDRWFFSQRQDHCFPSHR